MKKLRTLTCNTNFGIIKKICFYDLGSHQFQMELVTANKASAKKLNGMLIANLRISDAEGGGIAGNKLSFVTGISENKVVINENINDAISIIKSFNILEENIIKSLDDPDETDIIACLNKTKNIELDDCHQKSMEKRADQKIADSPSTLESDAAVHVLQLAEKLTQELNALSNRKDQMIIAEIVAKNLVTLGCKLEFNNQSIASSSTPPMQLNP